MYTTYDNLDPDVIEFMETVVMQDYEPSEEFNLETAIERAIRFKYPKLANRYDTESIRTFASEADAERFYNEWNKIDTAWATDIEYKDIAYQDGKIYNLRLKEYMYNTCSFAEWCKENCNTLYEQIKTEMQRIHTQAFENELGASEINPLQLICTLEEWDEYSRLQTLVYCIDGGDNDENNELLAEMENTFESRKVAKLKEQVVDEDKFHHVITVGDMFIIGQYADGEFLDYYDSLNLNIITLSDCYRHLIRLNNKTPIL